MFVDETLKTHLETSATINLKSLVLAEWNMNIPDNIFKTGNYRYRPNEVGDIYSNLPQSFDRLDIGKYYTDALESNVVIDGGVTNTDTPQVLLANK